MLSNEDKYLAFGLTISKVSRDTWDFKGDFKGDLEDDLFFNSLELDTELVGFDLIIIKIKISVLVFKDSIVPSIYENIEIKVGKNGSEKNTAKVSNFMKFSKSKKVVEKIEIRPR